MRYPGLPLVVIVGLIVMPGIAYAKTKKTGDCPANANEASRSVWPKGSLRTGDRQTRRHKCGRELECVGGTSHSGPRRTCRWL